MKKRYWLVLNHKGQPLVNIFNVISIFWDKKGNVSKIVKEMTKRARKKRYLVKATILWNKK